MEPILFESDTTFRWSCRRGDYLLWFRCNGLFERKDHLFRMQDTWEMKDGDFVTFTNRWEDLPPDFQLHPLETSDSLIPHMQKKLDAGYNPPEPMEGPHIWKVLAGDRVAWCGPSRPGLREENGILALVDFRACALVYGEPFDFSGDLPHFGGFVHEDPPPEALKRAQNAVRAVLNLGLPRIMSLDERWTLGT